MAKVRKLRLDVDLEDLFGTDVPDEALREAIGGAIIDRITERTQKERVDKNGVPFAKYSKDYTESLEFKAFGKSPGVVDMSLTGDMLADLNVTQQNSGKITIGFNDETQNAKAFNHVTGDTVPKRDFFGISKAELEQIRTEFADVVGSFKSLQDAIARKASSEEVRTLTVATLRTLLEDEEAG